MRNIVAFDVETTGLSFKDDYIIQLSAIKLDRDFNILEKFDEYVIPNTPEWEIGEEAFEKHGLTKEFIYENGKSLFDVGKRFLSMIEDCDLLSYNGNVFDMRMLSKDFHTVGLNISLHDRAFIDALKLEHILHPRTLETVYKNYTGKELEGAHNSLYDVEATIEIFHHQVALFAEKEVSIDDIMSFEESKLLCVDGMIKFGENGDILFAKGKYKDVEFMEVCKRDSGYIKWFMNNSEFDVNTKYALKMYYNARKN